MAVGAGLRVSEIAKLRTQDVGVQNNREQYGVYVADSKHGVSRVVVLGNKTHWVLEACADYCNLLGDVKPEECLIRGVKPLRGGQYRSAGKSPSVRQIQAICEPPDGYQIEYRCEGGVPDFILVVPAGGQPVDTQTRRRRICPACAVPLCGRLRADLTM